MIMWREIAGSVVRTDKTTFPVCTGSRLMCDEHTIPYKLRSKQFSGIVEYSENIIPVDSALINPVGKLRLAARRFEVYTVYRASMIKNSWSQFNASW
jgi:hypothetical protein